jgi:AcrR family transcriptional regulator
VRGSNVNDLAEAAPLRPADVERRTPMIDLTSGEKRYISAALALAAERPWAEVTLSEIAQRAGGSLVDLKSHFASKSDVLRAFVKLVDDEVLARAPVGESSLAPRDALFEVIMSRFDVLEPWKPALRSIVGAGIPEPGQVLQVLASNRWMLEAAGIGSGGVDGMARTAGLASVYASVFRTWLDDDDQGLARTMAALDRRLRRGEETLRRVEDVCRGIGRIGGAIFGAADAVRSRMDPRRRTGSDPSAPEADRPAP